MNGDYILDSNIVIDLFRKDQVTIEKMTDKNVNITLTQDEALILYDFLSRLNSDDRVNLFDDQAEQRVLWDMECALEKNWSSPYRQTIRTWSNKRVTGYAIRNKNTPQYPTYHLSMGHSTPIDCTNTSNVSSFLLPINNCISTTGSDKTIHYGAALLGINSAYKVISLAVYA